VAAEYLVGLEMATLTTDLNVNFLPTASFGLDYIKPIRKGYKPHS